VGVGAFAAAGSAGALGWAQAVPVGTSVTCTEHVTLCGMTTPAPKPSYDPTPAEADGGPPETDADHRHYDHND
jgi:hypothetical protein